MSLRFRSPSTSNVVATPRVTWFAFWAAFLIGSTNYSSVRSQDVLDFDRLEILDEVVDLVAEHFYDRDMDYDRWRERVDAEYRALALQAQDHDAFADVLNDLLASLNASHTYYYSRLDPRRYQLLGVFQALYDPTDDSLFTYEGIGIRTSQVGEQVFVRAVLDGTPADQAGMRFGDVLVSIDKLDFHPIRSFRGKQRVEVKLLRNGQPLQVSVNVVSLDGRSMFQDAMRASVEVTEVNTGSIGYIHVWSYAGTEYQEILREATLWGPLADCDALMLDLRGGWGGADVNYLNLFREPIVEVQSKPRQGVPQNFSGVWGKPVALIVDEHSTSGKELFAFGFRKLGLGKVFGQTTAGAVLAGRVFLLANGDVLYLAVADVQVDGIRLEGSGVEVDVPVARPLDSADQRDTQLEAAIGFLQHGVLGAGK